MSIGLPPCYLHYEGSAEADALSSALGREGAANLPLRQALSCLVDCDGYIPALAQAALLEAYGRHTVAIEAAALADAFRAHAGERPVPNRAQPVRPTPCTRNVES